MSKVVFLPVRTYSLSNQREHWSKRARRTRRERSDAFLCTPKVKAPCTVTLTRLAPRKLDDDNLRGCLKAFRDGVAQRLGIDDGSDAVKWEYAQMSAGSKEYGVFIEVSA